MPASISERLLAGLILLLTIGCAALPRVGPGMVDAISVDHPGIDTPRLEAARKLYARRCGSCHGAHLPSEYSEAKWPAIVDDMSDEAKLKPGEREEILLYLVAARRAPQGP